MPEPEVRPSAFETDDGALRCYLDQLPPDRCVFCAAPAQMKLMRVAGPVHHVSVFEELADGSAAGRVAAGVAILAGNRAMLARGTTQQTKGHAWLAVCATCTPKPLIPAILAVVLVAASAGQIVVGGGVLVTVVGFLLAAACAVIAIQRSALRVGEIDEDDHMFKLRRVAPEIMTEVLALGPRPHPSYAARGAVAPPNALSE